MGRRVTRLLLSRARGDYAIIANFARRADLDAGVVAGSYVGIFIERSTAKRTEFPTTPNVIGAGLYKFDPQGPNMPGSHGTCAQRVAAI